MSTSGDGAPPRTGAESADQSTNISPPSATPRPAREAAAERPDTAGGPTAERGTSATADSGRQAEAQEAPQEGEAQPDDAHDAHGEPPPWPVPGPRVATDRATPPRIDEPAVLPIPRSPAENGYPGAAERDPAPEDTVPLPPVSASALPHDDEHSSGTWPKAPIPEDRPLWAPRRPLEPPVDQCPPIAEAPDHRRRVATFFRLPTPTDPAPASTRLLVMCAWATALGGLGLAVALRGLLRIIAGTAPGWYEPVLIGVVLSGMALTVGGFTSMQRRWLPWAMLGAATACLAVAFALTF